MEQRQRQKEGQQTWQLWPPQDKLIPGLLSHNHVQRQKEDPGLDSQCPSLEPELHDTWRMSLLRRREYPMISSFSVPYTHGQYQPLMGLGVQVYGTGQSQAHAYCWGQEWSYSRMATANSFPPMVLIFCASSYRAFLYSTRGVSSLRLCSNSI